ncbi:MAG TPA: GNAT family N-acetyltransferase [Gemmatimonadales bacterium]|nr:GNAT family N-acetyltransferase [Gemmatimonadales bacterium]
MPTGATVTIRPAVPADLPAIGRLGALLVQTHHDFDPARFIAASPATPQGYANFLGTQLTEARVVILVAEQEGNVAGYVYAGLKGMDYMALRGPAGAIYDVVVDPAVRRRGVGRLLLDAAVERLKGMGAPQVVLSTAAKNEEAQRLFAKAGFRPTMVEMTKGLGGGQ